MNRFIAWSIAIITATTISIPVKYVGGVDYDYSYDIARLRMTEGDIFGPQLPLDNDDYVFQGCDAVPEPGDVSVVNYYVENEDGVNEPVDLSSLKDSKRPEPRYASAVQPLSYRGYDTAYVYNVMEDVQVYGGYVSSQLADLTVTYYCLCEKCCQVWSWEHSSKLVLDNYSQSTKMGGKPTEGRTIAVDPSVIPYNSVVHIDGVNYIAEDCGGGVKGYHIDIFLNDHEKCQEYGRNTNVPAIIYRR